MILSSDRISLENVLDNLIRDLHKFRRNIFPLNFVIPRFILTQTSIFNSTAKIDTLKLWKSVLGLTLEYIDSWNVSADHVSKFIRQPETNPPERSQIPILIGDKPALTKFWCYKNSRHCFPSYRITESIGVDRSNFIISRIKNTDTQLLTPR